MLQLLLSMLVFANAASLDLKGGRKLAITATEIQLFKGGKKIAVEPLEGLTAKKITLKKLEPFEPEAIVVQAVVGPTDEGDKNLVVVVSHDKIVMGPAYFSGGRLVREFDFSRLKNNRQIRVLIGTDAQTLSMQPSLKVVRHRKTRDEQVPMIVEETHTWVEDHFEKQTEFEYGLDSLDRGY